MAKNPWVLRTLCLLGAGCTAIGCAPDPGEPGGAAADDIVQVRSALGTKVQFGTVFQAGMEIRFFEILSPSGVDAAALTGLAACDAKSLFAVMPDTDSAFSLYYSGDEGLSFTKVFSGGAPASAKSQHIACDDGQLFTLECFPTVHGCTKAVYSATRIGTKPDINIDGNDIGAWVDTGAEHIVDAIQGGDGTIYGVQYSATGGANTLYKATTRQGFAWTPVSNIGSKSVTGVGSSNVSKLLAWPRRAFTVEQNGVLLYNDTILSGENFWPNFASDSSERFSVLTAAKANLLYGLETVNGHHLVTIAVKEIDCTDLKDNDADGKTDSEDDACVEPRAVAFCALPGTLNGTYCVNRYQPSPFLDQTPNQNAGLVTCTNHLVVPPDGPNGPKVPKPGACLQVGTRSDRLLTQAELAAPNPTGGGRWCNRYFFSGAAQWGLNFGTLSADPCGTSGTIVRAGLYSRTAENSVHISCTNGSSATFRGIGDAPLQSAQTFTSQFNKRCLVTVSASALPMFDHPFPLAAQGSTSAFQHAYKPVPLAQFGLGQPDSSAMIDLEGRDTPAAYHGANDIIMAEGTPLYAMADGTVLNPNGARDRDVHGYGCQGGYQGEIYVKYFIGSGSGVGPNYQESFVVYYAHDRRKVVVPGQTVRRGQLLGYVGRTGCASGPHLHISGLRTSNVNAHKSSDVTFGWHLPYSAESDPRFGSGDNMEGSNVIDLLGWRNTSAPDPWGYVWRNDIWFDGRDSDVDYVGIGGWSPNLFKPGEAFPYPHP